MMENKKINLLFDVTSMAGHLKNGTGTGIYTVSYNILKELCLRKIFNIVLYCDIPQLKNLQQGLQKEKSVIKKLKIFSNQNYDDFDIFFSPMYKIPFQISQQPNIEKYIFLHDTIPYFYSDYFTDQGNEWFFEMFHSLKQDDFYFMNSKQTQMDFIKYNSNISENNSLVTYLACNERFIPSRKKIDLIKKKYNITTGKKYVFSLCTLEPRKNLIRTIKTFIQFIDKNNIDDMIFVLGGGSWRNFIPILEQELSLLNKYRNKILTIGYVDDDDLAPLYSGAEWFVYTSQYEGFGLPPLEAMACGCPVITSNNSSLPEVVGDAGIMIDWDSDEQHIKAYERYYFDKKFRDEMAQKGLNRSNLFSWKKTVDIIENTMIERLNNSKKANSKYNNSDDKIKIIYDANLLASGLTPGHQRSGVYFVVYNLLKELIQQDDIKIYLWTTDKNLKHVKTVISADKELKDIPFVFQSNFPNMDAYLSPHSDIPNEILKYGNIRTYKIVHDFMGCIFPDKIFSTTLENHQRAATRCNKLFCISENTKKDYLKYVPKIDANKLIVTYEGANQNFYPHTKDKVNVLKKRLNIKNKYILSVCNLAPHKNLFLAIDSFIDFITQNNIKDLIYILVGDCPNHFKDEFNKKMQSLGEYKKYIITTGYLLDDDLPILYSGAEWFVFPSLYEGFGLPVLEAMQCGCPVVCSNTSSMPEILGDCGILVSPKNKDDFVEAFSKIYKSENLRTKLRNSGLQRAKMFSWTNMAKKITNCINVDYNKKRDFLPIVLITDENYVAPTVVTITSAIINKYANTNYKFYILGNSLSDKSKKLFYTMDNVELINIEHAFEEFDGTHIHVSATALLKFKIADIFSQYDKILYLDTDILVQQDLSELFKTDISEYYAAVVKDIECMIYGKHHTRLDLDNYFNSGMMLLNLTKMRNNNISDKLIAYKKQDKSKYFMDQDALNKIFNQQVIFIAPYFNYIPVSLNRFNTKEICDFYDINIEDVNYLNTYAPICHLANKNKPWKTRKAPFYPEWIRYYYLSVLKNQTLIYHDENETKTNSIKKFYFCGIPIFSSYCDTKKNGDTKYKRYFCGIPYLVKEKADFKKIYKFLGFSKTIYKRILGKTFLFSKQKISSSDIKGLSKPENWGRWSDGNTVDMQLKLPTDKGDLKCVLVLKPYLNEKCKQQTVSVVVNDTFMVDWSFELGKPAPKTEFIIPKTLLKKSGKTFFSFKIKNPISPKELRISSDSRKLGIGFISMKITPAIVKETTLKKCWKKIKDKFFPKNSHSINHQNLSEELIELKKSIENLQKEINALKKEQIITQKILLDEKTFLQKKRRLK